MRDNALRFVVCIRNHGYPEALEVRKLYRVLPDPKASALNLLRVIDESSEDYLYPSNYFAPVQLSRSTCRALGNA